MSVADKLLQLNQVKQDIKTAIETKGVPMTNVAFTEYANKILDISGGGSGNGGGWDISYEEYALALYYRFGKLAIFSNAWQDSQDSETVLFDIPLELVAPNLDMGGLFVDLYAGTDGQLQAFYDTCVNETILPNDVYYVNNVATVFAGGEFPMYIFGAFLIDNDNNSFIVADLTSLEMGLGLVLMKNVNVSIPNNNIVIQQGFKFENESGIIIPDNTTSIGTIAFSGWKSYNQPLVIPNSVTSIGLQSFYGWESNNQPLVIPNSVTSIEQEAFCNWYANNQPLVIPNSVTSIGYGAFANWYLVPYIEIQSLTPPTLGSPYAFAGQNNAPIYVPDESVDDYKTATNWVVLASRIFSINDK